MTTSTTETVSTNGSGSTDTTDTLDTNSDAATTVEQPETDNEDEKTVGSIVLGYISGVAGRLWNNITQDEKSWLPRQLEKEPVQEGSAKIVEREGRGLIGRIRDGIPNLFKAMPEETQESLSPYQKIRDAMKRKNPNESLGRRILNGFWARLLSLGARLTAFLGVDLAEEVHGESFGGDKEKYEKNTRGWLGSLLARFFGKKEEATPEPVLA
jgi:hypothetical protein